MEAEKRHLWFCEVITLFGYISMLCALYWIFSRSENGELMDPGTLLWCICVLVGFFALRLYLRKERTLFEASLFALIAFGVQTAVLIIFSPTITGFFGYAFAIVFWAVVAYQSYSFNVYGITLMKMTTMLEGSVALLILVLFYQTTTGLSELYVLPLLSTVFLSLFGLIAMRTTDGERDSRLSGFRGIMVISCVLLLLGVVILAFLMFAYAPMGDAVISVYHALVWTVKVLMDIIMKIIIFIASLLPKGNGSEMLPPEAAPDPVVRAAEEYMGNPAIVEAMIIAAGVIGVIMLIWQITRLRGIKISGDVIRRRGSRIKRTGDSLFHMILLFFAGIKAKISFFVMTILYRHTPPGLLIYLERWAKLHKMPRRSGETHRAFLSRLSQGESRETAGLLAELSNALDLRYYAPIGTKEFFPKETAMAIRRGFGKHDGKSAV